MHLKKSISFLFLLTLFALSAMAEGPFRLGGKVTDAQTGEPLPGVVVRLDDNYLWAVTGKDGCYTFDKVQEGSYTLNASYLGYVDINERIDIRGDVSGHDLEMSLNSLALKEVVVTAESSKDNVGTSRRIGRNALDHMQVSSMTNIAALMPGGKTVNPDLSADNVLALRSGGTTAGNAAFGTAIEIDGVRMGDNASLTGMNGVSTRGISVENIESVEVITGVPSAEYGDLNNGMVRVITKKGRTPVSVTFSVNPRTYETSASKGIDLGEGRGILNVSGELARATRKLTSPYTSYTRRGFTFDYSNTFNHKWRLEAGVTGNIGGMDSKDDPDLFSEEYSTARDNLLTPHFKLLWLLNEGWVTNLRLEGSVYYHDQTEHVHSYNSFASSQPSVHAEAEGYSVAEALPLTYYSDQVTDSRELDWAAGLHYDWLKRWGKRKNVLKAGIQWKANGNVGEGEYYQDPALAANGYRPRPYSEYPYMHNLAAYLEDKLTLPIGGTVLDVSAGLRLEKLFIRGTSYDNLRTLSPRLNAKWSLGEKVAVRTGWGITRKLPSFYILFPRQEYRDIQTFAYSYGQAGEAAYIYYTQPYTMAYNPGLRWQRNTNAEAGIDIDAGGIKVSLVAFSNITSDPYEFTNAYTPFSYGIMSLPEGFRPAGGVEAALDRQTGQVWLRNSHQDYWTAADLKVKDRTFAAARRQANGGAVRRKGAELTADFPEIKALRTQLRLDAAYTLTRFVDDIEYAYYNNGWSHTSVPDMSYQYAGIYAGGNSVSNGRETRNLDANLTSITHIPEARIIITCRLEAALLRYSRNLSEHDGKTYAFTVSETSNEPTGGDIYDGNSYTAVMPIAYMDLDGFVHPFTQADLSNPELSRLVVRSSNLYTFARDGYDPYFSANLSVTKEIGDHVSVSFFANNFTNSRRFVKSHATGIAAIFTPAFYYGLTCRIKL